MKNILSIIKKHKLFIILYFVILAVIFLTYRHYGTGADEDIQQPLIGIPALKFYLTLGKDKTIFNIYSLPGHSIYGPTIEILLYSVQLIFHGTGIYFYHLFTALLCSLSFIFIYKTLLLLIDSPPYATVGVVLLFLFPRFYGDIFNNSKDAPLVLLIGIVIYLQLRLLKSKNITAKHIGILAVFSAVLSNQRLVGLYIVGLSVLFLMIKIIVEKSGIKKIIKLFFLFVAIFLITLYITHPFLLAKPITGIYDMVKATFHFPLNEFQLFEGVYYLSNNLPWYYIPKWIIITTPPFILFNLLVGFLTIVYYLFYKKANVSKSLFYIYLVCVFIFPFLLIIISRPTLYDGWRHFLFLSYPLTLIAALGFYFLVKTVKKKIAPVIWILFFIFVLFTSKEMLILHPYEYIYFNALAGGLRGAQNKYDTDYWGKSIYEAVQYVIQNKNKLSKGTDILYISHCYSGYLIQQYISNNKDIVIDRAKATVYICFNRGNNNLSGFGRVIYRVDREGVTLSTVQYEDK